MPGTRDTHQPWCGAPLTPCSCGLEAASSRDPAPALRLHEGRTNPDSDIVEAALDSHSLPEATHREVWEALHVDGRTAAQIAALTEARFPGFAAALRRPRRSGARPGNRNR